MENVMMDYMYDIPSDDEIDKLTITKEIVDSHLLLDQNMGEQDSSSDKDSDQESA